MKILFISHTFPPVVGGVESQNYELYSWLSKITDVKLIANKKRWLIPFFLPFAAIWAVFLSRKYDAILLGSCILGNVSWFVKIFSKKPVIAVAHGLDLTWKNNLYQSLWIKAFIPSIDKIIAVGNETIKIAGEKGISKEKIIFIPNGVDLAKYSGKKDRHELEKLLGEDLSGKYVILTSGRLAKRKGVAWFIRNVMPKLSENILYIVAGSGPDKDNIQSAIEARNMQKRVKALGYVTDEVRDMLFHTSDIFVQPNIKIEDDMEGFGISVIEAAYCGIPVIAAKLEGLQDAIKDGLNGFLVEPCDTPGYVAKINELLADDNFRRSFGEKAKQFVINNYSWEKIAKRYLEEIKKTLNNN